jgi:hypothetical protein
MKSISSPKFIGPKDPNVGSPITNLVIEMNIYLILINEYIIWIEPL